MKKVYTLCTLILSVFLIVACTPEATDEQVTKELEGMSDEELENIIEENEEEQQKASVGEASRWRQEYQIHDLRVTRERVLMLSRVELLQRYQNYLMLAGSEACSNGIDDNDQDSHVDCADITDCYSNSKAPLNICDGEKSKVLLAGDGLGTHPDDTIKRDKDTDTLYTSAEHACQVTLGEECVAVEVYQSQKWIDVYASIFDKDQEITCGTVLSGTTYRLVGDDRAQYRAVCGLSTVDVPPPSPPVGGILNN